MARLGDVCSVITDGSHFSPQDVGIGYPMMSVKDMGERGFSFEDCKHICVEDYRTLVRNGCKPQKNDVLLAKDGSFFKYAFVVEQEQELTVLSSIAILRPKTNLINPKYLREFLMADSTYETVSLNYISGTALKRVILQGIRKIELPLPSLSEQQHIAERFNALANLISLRKQQLAKLDELVKARFVGMFGDPMTNSNGYPLKRYADLFELNAGGTPSKQNAEYWDNGTISWIGSNLCQNSILYENDGNYITEEGLKHSSARMFPIGTVLVALVGATIGKTALLKFETTTNQNVLGIRGIRESGYTPEFVFFYTQGLYPRFLSIGDGGFTMASKGFISELPMPIVELSLQEQFAAFVAQTNKQKLTIQQSLDKLELMKKALMQKYFV